MLRMYPSAHAAAFAWSALSFCLLLAPAHGIVATRSTTYEAGFISSHSSYDWAMDFFQGDLTLPLTNLQVSVAVFLPDNSGNIPFTYGQTSYPDFYVCISEGKGHPGSQFNVDGIDHNCILPTGTFTRTANAPGLVVMNFADNAPIPITSVGFPYTGNFQAAFSLDAFVNEVTSAEINSVTETPRFFVFVYSGTALSRFLSTSVTVNCPAARSYALYYPFTIPRQPPTAFGYYAGYTNFGYPPYFWMLNGGQVALENVVRRGTGINARLSGITVDFNVDRATGSNLNCNTHADSITANPANFADTSIILQFFPEVGPMVSILLDSGVGAQSSVNTWATGNLDGPTTSTTTWAYWINIGSTTWNEPESDSAVYYGADTYRKAAGSANLNGASPYGTWRLLINDAILDHNYWCGIYVGINLQTCDSSSTTPCC